MNSKLSSCLLATVLAIAPKLLVAESSNALDNIAFGNANSETAHHLKTVRSELTTNSPGETARILLPGVERAWDGGRLEFTLAVDPAKQNYGTIRLWGSDGTVNDLILFCEGKQVGYRHLGDIDLLDIGGEHAAFPGRFIYQTIPLPLAMTQGKTNLSFEIRSSGPIWPYGNTFDRFQKPMTSPTRGIYKFYSHTDGCFTPPAGEKQGGVAEKSARAHLTRSRSTGSTQSPREW